MMRLDEDVDPGDLDFMDPIARMRALGVDDEVMSPEVTITETGEYPVVTMNEKSPPPGIIRVNLEKLARGRGLVHHKGQFEGKIMVARICQGTELAYTTVLPYINRPDRLTLLYTETLARLCDFLKCTPGELLEYVPNDPRNAALSEAYKRG